MAIIIEFCNICYKINDGSLKNISEENMKHLKNILDTFVEHDIIKHNETYICQLCCEELIRFDNFRKMCLSHLIELRQKYFNMLSKLELENGTAAEKNTLKDFVLQMNSLEKNNCQVSVSTECPEIVKSSKDLNTNDSVLNREVINSQSQRNKCEFDSDCNDVFVINSVTECDESLLVFTNEEDMENVKISCSEDIILETSERKSNKNFNVCDINNANVSSISQKQYMREEIDLKYEIESSNSEHFTLNNFENECNEHSELDFKVPVVNNNEESVNSGNDSTEEKLHVKKENSTSKGVELQTIVDEFGHDLNVAFQISNVCTVVNMEDSGHEDIGREEANVGLQLGSTESNNKPTAQIINMQPSHSLREHHAATLQSSAYKSGDDPLIQHKSIRIRDKRYKCTVCNKAYAAVSGLTLHQRIHSAEWPYQCTVCNKAFSNSSKFIRHKRTHSGDRPYNCTVCKKSFTQSRYLIGHEHTHGGTRPYKCSICKKAFALSCNLIAHERTHSCDRPYKCTVCNKTSTRRYHLTAHQHTHSGYKPYKCNVCKKDFLRLFDLTRHERTHSGDKPYKCTVCNKAFAHSFDLARHKRTHSGDNIQIHC